MNLNEKKRKIAELRNDLLKLARKELGDNATQSELSAFVRGMLYANRIHEENHNKHYNI